MYVHSTVCNLIKNFFSKNLWYNKVDRILPTYLQNVFFKTFLMIFLDQLVAQF